MAVNSMDYSGKDTVLDEHLVVASVADQPEII